MVVQYFTWNYFTHYRNYKQLERKKASTSLTCDTGIRQQIVYHVYKENGTLYNCHSFLLYIKYCTCLFFYTNDNGGLLLLSLLASPSTSITIVVAALAIALPRSLLCITSVCPICSSLIQTETGVFFVLGHKTSYLILRQFTHMHQTAAQWIFLTYSNSQWLKHLINPLASHS